MRTHLLLAIALLATPLAAAGIDAQVDLDESSSSCSSYEQESWQSDSYEDTNESYSYRYWHYQYADAEGNTCSQEGSAWGVSASDDHGQLAWVGTRSSNTSSEHWSNEGTGTYAYYQAWDPESNSSFSSGSGGSEQRYTYAVDEAWSSETGVEVLDGRAYYASGCDEQRQAVGSGGWNDHSWSSNGESHSSSGSTWGNDYQSSDSCREGVETGMGPRDAFVGRTSDCQNSGQGQTTWASSDYGNDSWDTYTDSFDSDYSCRNAYGAEAMGTQLGAVGTGGTCEWQDSFEESRSTQGDSSYQSQSSSSSSKCTDGIFVEALTGMDVFVGFDSERYEDCYTPDGNETECYQYERQYGFAQVTWAASPFGPDHVYYAALP